MKTFETLHCSMIYRVKKKIFLKIYKTYFSLNKYRNIHTNYFINKQNLKFINTISPYQNFNFRTLQYLENLKQVMK